jgi:hypothetical protein
LLNDVAVAKQLKPDETALCLEAWEALCHVVMNRKEFIYLF